MADKKKITKKIETKSSMKFRPTNYPAGDFLIQIKNAAIAHNHEVVVRNTKFVKAIATELKKLGFLHEIEVGKEDLKVSLAYQRKEPVLLDVKLVSKPGLRIYMTRDELSKIKGPSTFILTTPNGIMSSREAIKKGAGGEVIAEIW